MAKMTDKQHEMRARKRDGKQTAKQQDFFKKDRSDYGGDLYKTRKGRSHGRPLSTKSSMHLVLRSSQAVGPMSFRRHDAKIKCILKKFSEKYGIRILSMANVGNHLHLQIKLSNRQTYKPFIRAITSAIMMAVTGVNRWTKCDGGDGHHGHDHNHDGHDAQAPGLAHAQSVAHKVTGKFWDLRPFTRILTSFCEHKYLRNYLAINRLEAHGYTKQQARFLVFWDLYERIHGGTRRRRWAGTG